MANSVQCSTLQLYKALESPADIRVAFQYVIQVVIEEAVLIHLLQNNIKIIPVVFYAACFGAKRGLDGCAQGIAQCPFILLEQLGDELVFAFEVIIEVAWTDIHFVGYIDCGGVGLALLIEQSKAGMKDSVPCFHRVGVSGFTGFR